MPDIEREIRNRVDEFVGELSDLVRQAALEAISDALDGNGPVASNARAATRLAAGSHLKGSNASRRPNGKRTAEEIEAMTRTLVAYVQKNPGRGVEQISAELGVTSRDLTLPIKKLLAAGKLSTKGQKRATKYFVNGSAPKRGRRTASKRRSK